MLENLPIKQKKTESTIVPSLCARPIYDLDMRISHARAILPTEILNLCHLSLY